MYGSSAVFSAPVGFSFRRVYALRSGYPSRMRWRLLLSNFDRKTTLAPVYGPASLSTCQSPSHGTIGTTRKDAVNVNQFLLVEAKQFLAVTGYEEEAIQFTCTSSGSSEYTLSLGVPSNSSTWAIFHHFKYCIDALCFKSWQFLSFAVLFKLRIDGCTSSALSEIVAWESTGEVRTHGSATGDLRRKFHIRGSYNCLPSYCLPT